jgi:hypothetical protein
MQSAGGATPASAGRSAIVTTSALKSETKPERILVSDLSTAVSYLSAVNTALKSEKMLKEKGENSQI